MKDPLLDELRKMPPEQRSKLNLFKKRGSYNTTKEEYLNRNRILEWAKEKGVRSQRQVRKQRGPGEPSVEVIIKAFGSWNNFLSEIGIERKKEEKPPSDFDYIANVIVQFGLFDADDYRNARKKRPDVIPSMYMVMKQFGTWKNASLIAARVSVQYRVDEYIKLKNRYGRWPTPTECRNARINIEPLVDIHGSKRALDAFLDKAQKVDNYAE